MKPVSHPNVIEGAAWIKPSATFINSQTFDIRCEDTTIRFRREETRVLLAKLQMEQYSAVWGPDWSIRPSLHNSEVLGEGE